MKNLTIFTFAKFLGDTKISEYLHVCPSDIEYLLKYTYGDLEGDVEDHIFTNIN
jgi:hypothetical protein